MNSHLATLADSSSLLLGLGRPLSEADHGAPPIPRENPVPGILSGFGESTRFDKNVTWFDSGMSYSTERFQSEMYPIQAPMCDGRNTTQIFGSSSRLDGRGPMLK